MQRSAPTRAWTLTRSRKPRHRRAERRPKKRSKRDDPSNAASLAVVQLRCVDEPGHLDAGLYTYPHKVQRPKNADQPPPQSRARETRIVAAEELLTADANQAADVGASPHL